MADYIESLQVLTEHFARLPGIGKKTAMRLAYSVLDLSDEDAADFSRAITDAKEKIHLCPVCQNLTDRDVCTLCSDRNRDRTTVCVVEDSRAVMSIERVREYNGLYHVLHGVISPVAGITPEMIKLKELLSRIGDDENEIKELIIATNPTVEGEATAMYISRLVKPFGLKVTRLAYGIPVGGDLEYADEITLGRAIEGRHEI